VDGTIQKQNYQSNDSALDYPVPAICFDYSPKCKAICPKDGEDSDDWRTMGEVVGKASPCVQRSLARMLRDDC